MIPRRLRRPALLPVLATALTVLLALLAFLQYRWLGQVSEGERQRLKATLEARARDFARDFDREVTRAAATFHVPPAPGGELDPAVLATRWNDWRQNAPFPELIREVLFLQVPLRGEPSLRRLDRGAKAFVGTEWPASLASWRAANQGSGAGSGADAGGGPVGIPRLMAALDDSPILLVTMPFVRVFRQTAGAPLGEPLEPARTSFLLVSLDLDQIRGKVLPQLVSRYFSTEDIFDYRVLVAASADPGKVIFSSDPAPATSARHLPPADAVVPLFAVRMSEFNALFVPHVEALAMQTAGSRQQAAGSQAVAGQPVGADLARPERAPEAASRRASAGSAEPPRVGDRPAPSEPGRGSMRAEGRVGPPTGHPAPSDRLAVSVIRLRSGTGDTAVAIDGTSGRWQLRLAHRAGSVDAAVARARNRNLLVSSTVLLLLAASFGLMVVSTRRSQRLAAQQVEFVAGVTHELRTPLAVIRSAGENLADGVVETPEDVRQYGALITSEGRKLGAMVERVMEYAGMQGSAPAGPREPVDTPALLEDVGQRVRRLPAAQGADIELAIPEHLPPVLGDGPALARALENLVENALKYGRTNGERPWVRVSARAEGSGGRGRVVIEVTDRGPGVEPSEREAIFEPFVRGRAALAARVPGTGLGLSLVRRIVEAHGGRAELRRTDDNAAGACFAITLPVGIPRAQ